MKENLQNIWLAGSDHTLVVLLVLQIIDLAFTLLHSLQELKGQLWRYFGAIAGVKIPDGVGKVVFFGGLTISLWVVGLLGVTGTSGKTTTTYLMRAGLSAVGVESG